MGYRAAAAGFFFDGMELVAALAPRAPGGIDGLRGGVELLFRERDAVNDHTRWLASLVEAAFQHPTAPPTTVDGYRTLLTAGVFEIVNRWSYIADLHTVNRLQAWFYAGFGLGRGTTVLKGVALAARLFEIVGEGTPADDAPGNLQRLAAESAKQLDVSAREDDLVSVRPLLLDAADRMKRASIALLRPLPQVRFGDEERLDLEALADVRRRVELDLAGTRIAG
jgi:hypothetical protein